MLKLVLYHFSKNLPQPEVSVWFLIYELPQLQFSFLQKFLGLNYLIIQLYSQFLLWHKHYIPELLYMIFQL